MKRHFFISIILFLWAISAASAWTIPGYYTRMEVHPDSSVDVTETIIADFTGDPHHGIYREIPFATKDRCGNKNRIRHKIVSVTDENGQKLQSMVTNSGGRVKIKIGDPDVTVQDRRVYVIRYHLLRAVQFFHEQDELYWNPVGDEWQVGVENAVCDVVLPPKVPKNSIQWLSFSGVYGSTTSDVATQMLDSRTVRFKMTRTLVPGEGMTVVVGWPKNIVQQPSLERRVSWFMADNGYVFLPPIFLLFIVWLWLRIGKDPDTTKSEVVTYDPPDDLRPAELGTLIDEKADIRDISATIVDLAVRGLVKITALEEKGFLSSQTDYLLELRVPLQEATNRNDMNDFELTLITALFSSGQSRKVSELSNSFYVHLPELKGTLYNSMIKHGYFTHRPDSVRSNYRAGGYFLMGVGFFLAIGLMVREQNFLFLSPGWGLAVGLCGWILAVAARVMPRKTVKGKEALLAARGFEEYLSRAEKAEIQYQERNNYFERFLPYAMALGIADKWARAFEGLQTQPPDWYSGDGGTFRPVIFARNLQSASRSWGETMSSQPRSSGSGGGSGFSGGSSGGGGGGGGGGAW